MKFHLLSCSGEGCSLMKRIQGEGNDVRINITDSDYKSAFEGILKKDKNPEKGAIIIVDSSGLGKEADDYKKRGFKVFGGSAFADRLEEERDFGLQYMQSHGIRVPETNVFQHFVTAEDWLRTKKDDERFVFKPNGKHLPCRLTYAGEDIEDLISYLRFVGRHFGHEIDDFVLQSFASGPVVSTEFWVGPGGFIYPANHTVEVKKFLNDNIGPSTGCQGNLVWVAEDDEVVSLLQNVEEDLVKEGYVGPIDLNAILSEEGPRGLEWTPRFGLDAMPTLLHLVDGDIGQLISDITLGQSQEMSLHNAVAGGVRITIPPYPIEPENLKKAMEQNPNIGVPIKGLDFENSYLYEVMEFEGQLVHSQGTGIIGVVSDCAEDPEDCFCEPYEILENAKIPDKQYRTDLDEVLLHMYQEACEALENVRA